MIKEKKLIHNFKKNREPFTMVFLLLFLVVIILAISLASGNKKNIIKSEASINRVVNGEVTKSDDWPFVVALFDARHFSINYTSGESNLDESISCTGVLISPEFVLTAGLCLLNVNIENENCSQIQLRPSQIGVAFGFSDLNNERIDWKNRSIQFAEHIFNLYDPCTSLENNDIALIKLTKPVKDIKTISLLKDKKLAQKMNKLLMLGYGEWDLNSKNDSFSTPQLRKLNVNNNPDFNQKTLLSIDGHYGTLRDSGGPVLIYKNKKWSLVGILQGIRGTVSGEITTINTLISDISFYTDWIQSVTGISPNEGSFIGEPPKNSKPMPFIPI